MEQEAATEFLYFVNLMITFMDCNFLAVVRFTNVNEYASCTFH